MNMSPLKIVKTAFSDFMDDEAPLRAAALAYYTVFSLAPLLILVLMLVGKIMDPDTVRDAMSSQFAHMMGPDAGKQIGEMVSSGRNADSKGAFAKILAFAALVFGATGAFGQLQGALNRVWEVRTDPKQGFAKTIAKRIFSFGMVLGIAFLLLVSLAVSAALASFGGAMSRMLPGEFSQMLLRVLGIGVSFAVITLLFSLMFKFIPDAEIEWRDVWVGGAVTAFLFTLGKFLIGLYLSKSDPGRAFGAASALAILLVWIYYSGLIVLLGAEFTQTLTEANGRHIEPSRGAVRLETAKKSDKNNIRPLRSLDGPDRDLHPLHRVANLPGKVLGKNKHNKRRKR